MPESSSEQGNTEDEDISEEVEPDTQPPLDRNVHVVRPVLDIETFSRLGSLLVLNAIGPDRRETGQGLGNRCVQRRTQDGVESLGLDRRCSVVARDEVVDDGQGSEDDAEVGEGVEDQGDNTEQRGEDGKELKMREASEIITGRLEGGIMTYTEQHSSELVIQSFLVFGETR